MSIYDRDNAFLSAFVKLGKGTIHFIMSVCPSVRPSVCPHGTIRLPLDEFLGHFTFEYFLNVCRRSSCFV